MSDRLPSVKQMVCRSNDGHRGVLRRLAADPDAVVCNRHQNPRGVMIVCATLRNWGCLDGWTITDRGRELLAAYGPERR